MAGRAVDHASTLDGGAAQTTTQVHSPRGFLSVEQIETVTRAGQSRLDICIERERQRGGRPNGKWIAFTIALDGTTTDIAAGSSAQPLFTSCLTTEIERWRFPPPDGGTVRVEYGASTN
jgi:hypothetical protein